MATTEHRSPPIVADSDGQRHVRSFRIHGRDGASDPVSTTSTELSSSGLSCKTWPMARAPLGSRLLKETLNAHRRHVTAPSWRAGSLGTSAFPFA